VRMWVFEETVDGQPLSGIINSRHENVKYLPGIALPDTLVATPDLPSLGEWADIFVFVLPHQFLLPACRTLRQQRAKFRSGAYAVHPRGAGRRRRRRGGGGGGGGGLVLLSDLIRQQLEVDCAVLMGANLAPEVAQETFCEATVGSRDPSRARELKALFETNYFRIGTTSDEVGVELCGALKNVVATGAGFCDGLGYGDNTKAAIIRLGLMEMMKFMRTFYASKGVQDRTFFESCGIADLVTTCYGGRNRRLAEAFVKTGKPISQLEDELLNGQKLQGPQTAAEVYTGLQAADRLAEFPLMAAVHLICERRLAPENREPTTAAGLKLQ
uniref:Glycerol-3-phosphate dehydrogenase [NAD(+)] n=1 Tax=Macrostomum lignano TaxID=282301 RepID=A0A1I8IXL2_9PLAT